MKRWCGNAGEASLNVHGDKFIKKDYAKGQGKRPRLNDEIDVVEVRLIGDDGQQVGIVATVDALRQAEVLALDLVEIAPDSEPPVCKIMDYGKQIFETKKQLAVQRKKQKQTQVKEMKFRPGTDDADYQIKLRNITRFLENGDKAKVTLRFRGRELAHQEIGMEMLKRIEKDLEELGGVEQFPKMEGRQLTMVIAPKSRKK